MTRGMGRLCLDEACTRITETWCISPRLEKTSSHNLSELDSGIFRKVYAGEAYH